MMVRHNSTQKTRRESQIKIIPRNIKITFMIRDKKKTFFVQAKDGIREGIS